MVWYSPDPAAKCEMFQRRSLRFDYDSQRWVHKHQIRYTVFRVQLRLWLGGLNKITGTWYVEVAEPRALPIQRCLRVCTGSQRPCQEFSVRVLIVRKPGDPK